MGSKAPHMAGPDASGQGKQGQVKTDTNTATRRNTQEMQVAEPSKFQRASSSSHRDDATKRRRRISRPQPAATSAGKPRRNEPGGGDGDDGENEDGDVGDDNDDDDDYSSISSLDEPPLIRAYGHTYHGSGMMIVPNDESERARLDLQHSLFKLCLDGNLTLTNLPDPSTLDHPLNILDIGAGTGIWAVELAERYPNARIRGVDLSAALLPTAVPANVTFELEDVNENWGDGFDDDELPSAPGGSKTLDLDFIHVRNITGGGVRDLPRLFAQAFEHLRPGGQIEVSEVRTRWFDYEEGNDEENLEELLPQSEKTRRAGGPQRSSQSSSGESSTDGGAAGAQRRRSRAQSRPIPACREMELNLAWMSQKLGIDLDHMPKVRGMLESAGFEKCMETSDLVPVNVNAATAMDDKVKRKTAAMAQLVEYGLENYTLALFGKCGWDENDARALINRVWKENQDPGMDAFGKVTFVTARKPVKTG